MLRINSEDDVTIEMSKRKTGLINTYRFLGSMLTKEYASEHEIKSGIAMANIPFTKKDLLEDKVALNKGTSQAFCKTCSSLRFRVMDNGESERWIPLQI